MWTQRLNLHATHFEIEGSQWEIYDWAYREHLISNVPHRHTFFEACLVGAHGEGIFSNEDERHPLIPGTFFLARPGALHQIVNTSSPEMELFWVCFALTHLGSGETGDLLRAFEHSSLVVAPQQRALTSIWETLRLVAQKSAHAGDVATLRYLSKALLLEIAQIGASESLESVAISLPVETSPSHSRLAKLGAQYVHDNLDRPLTPDEIARHLGVSRRQLTRLFTDYTGIPPALYIERSRLDRARGLLRAGRKSVKEIAATVGYSDVHHFTRAFTRVVGTSPAQYRLAGSPREALNSGPHIQKPGSLV